MPRGSRLLFVLGEEKHVRWLLLVRHFALFFLKLVWLFSFLCLLGSAAMVLLFSTYP